MLKNDPISQPVKLNQHLVPGIWQYMLPKEIFTWKIPEERDATCMSCPKVVTDGYRKDYRCCTYQPSVPNYSLGFALQTDLGQSNVRKIINGGFVLPEGSLHTPQEWYDYLDVTSGESFGNNEKILCPLLEQETGYCTIYAFRNSVCSTFFCLHDHGDKGQSFWERVQEMVGQVESVLQQWALVQVGFDLDGYYTTLNDMADDFSKIQQEGGGWTEAARKRLWGEWYGKEEELLIACAEAISANRDRLWEIANEFEMKEAEVYEKRQIQNVPKQLADEVDESDTQDGEAMSPDELYDRLKKGYKKLWTQSKKKLVLSRRVEINENDYSDPESKHFEKYPFELLFLNKKDPETYDWRKFITEDEAYILEQFERPRKFSKKLMKRLSDEEIGDPTDKISEWMCQKVLVQAT